MLCKVDGCNRESGKTDVLYHYTKYVVTSGMCPKHRKAYYRYGNPSGKQPIEQVCVWCDNKFSNKYLSNYCSEACRSKKSMRGRRSNSHEKVKARYDARKRISLSPCAVCGGTNNIHRHHKDYSKPLEVQFLCEKHHRESHSTERQTNI